MPLTCRVLFHFKSDGNEAQIYGKSHPYPKHDMSLFSTLIFPLKGPHFPKRYKVFETRTHSTQHR